MAEHFYSAAARLDLLEIWDYIAKDDVGSADRLRDEVEKAVRMLAGNPYLGHVRRDLTSKDVRFWAVYSYLIVYNPASSPLEIVRVLSGYRDVAILLDK